MKVSRKTPRSARLILVDNGQRVDCGTVRYRDAVKLTSLWSILNKTDRAYFVMAGVSEDRPATDHAARGVFSNGGSSVAMKVPSKMFHELQNHFEFTYAWKIGMFIPKVWEKGGTVVSLHDIRVDEDAATKRHMNCALRNTIDVIVSKL